MARYKRLSPRCIESITLLRVIHTPLRARALLSFFANFLKSFSKEIVELVEQDNSITMIARSRKKTSGR